jgi:hypothetical protein
MRRKKEKGYWQKRTERFPDGSAAKSRAETLRSHPHVAHVQVDREGRGYVVSYSVAQWYVEELERAGVTL